MRHILRLTLIVAIFGAPLTRALAADCRPAALAALHTSSPDGDAVYRAIADKGFFLSWIQCDDAQRELPTAVHESVHAITGDTDAFPLVGGGTVPRPHEVTAFFPPARIARVFGPSDFVSTYLKRGQSSSATDFLYLLDELNAYSHDLNAAVDLHHLDHPGQAVDHRDGLAALMAFTAVYVETAATSEPATWAGLRRPPVSDVVAALWTRAERVMAASCGIPDYGAEDRGFLQRVCDPAAQRSLRAVIGRAPVCPVRCLAAPAPPGQEEDASADPRPPGRRSVARR